MSNKKGKHMSVKHLESYLQDLDDFDEPKVELEQYATPPHIAALMLNTIDSTFDDIDDKFVADLGCGTGRLTVGSLLCGAAMVIGIDLDQSALDCGLRNVHNLFCESEKEDDDDDDEIDYKNLYGSCPNFNFVRADITESDCDGTWALLHKKFDTVIMNPPFGTKHNQGLDMVFLKKAIDLANNVVYSLHKTSTRNFIKTKCQQLGVKGKPVAQIRYNLDNTYKFHRKKSVDIDVDLWRIECSPNVSDSSHVCA